jgi:hypothetical protein
LTYKLIRAFIRTAVEEDRLHLVLPQMAADPVRRTLLVSNEVNNFLRGPWDDDADERRAGRLQSNLEHFVAGGVVPVCLQPRQAKAAFMGRLDPLDNGIWDIRSRDPKPGLRLLGGFTEPDVFVGLVWDFRLNLKTDDDWKSLQQRCRSEWRSLFAEEAPLLGEEVHDYISENFISE